MFVWKQRPGKRSRNLCALPNQVERNGKSKKYGTAFQLIQIITAPSLSAELSCFIGLSFMSELSDCAYNHAFRL